MPSPIQMKTLLEAGVHFGHQTRRWNPKMKPFIFTERNGIHIIDLQQTVRKLEDAMTYVRDLSADDGTILFVGTKKQAQETIERRLWAERRSAEIEKFVAELKTSKGINVNEDELKKVLGEI